LVFLSDVAKNINFVANIATNMLTSKNSVPAIETNALLGCICKDRWDLALKQGRSEARSSRVANSSRVAHWRVRDARVQFALLRWAD
jgi:hypothetical protein